MAGDRLGQIPLKSAAEWHCWGVSASPPTFHSARKSNLVEGEHIYPRTLALIAVELAQPENCVPSAHLGLWCAHFVGRHLQVKTSPAGAKDFVMEKCLARSKTL